MNTGTKLQQFWKISLYFRQFNVILERFCYILIQKTRNTWNKEEKFTLILLTLYYR